MFHFATLSLASLIAPAALQEPQAPPPPVSMPEILAAIEKLRGAYDQADQKVREAVELPAPQPADRKNGLDAAKTSLDQLDADMEALLKLLPASS